MALPAANTMVLSIVCFELCGMDRVHMCGSSQHRQHLQDTGVMGDPHGTHKCVGSGVNMCCWAALTSTHGTPDMNEIQ